MEPTPPTWPQRFMAAFAPSDGAIVFLVLLMAFVFGILVGLVLTSREVSREVPRSAAEVQVPQRSGPTLSQRLDAIEQRLLAIEQRLSKTAAQPPSFRYGVKPPRVRRTRYLPCCIR